MIKDVQVHALRQIPDERGKVIHMLGFDDPQFEKFGEIYFSVFYPDVIKGWHLHKRMTLNYAIVSGIFKLLLYPKNRDTHYVISLKVDQRGFQYMSDAFQQEIAFFGIESTPAFVRAPEGNGCAERFIRMLKEQLPWTPTFRTVERLRVTLHEWPKTCNELWLIEPDCAPACGETGVATERISSAASLLHRT